VPAIGSLLQLEALVENIVELQRARADLERAQEQEIAHIRLKYRAPLAEVERYLTLETTWAETWAQANPAALKADRRLECSHGILGFRAPQPRLERASRKWTWSGAAQRLAEVTWGSRYLRLPPREVNKEALVADRAKFSALELREIGLKIVEHERFFVTPHGAESVPEEETAWQEAA
jgi:hypothetical protein